MKLAFAVSISTAMLVWTAAAQAASPQLNGQYAFTGTAACLVSGTPFNADHTPTSFTIQQSFSVIGVRTFNGNGTGTIKGRSVNIVPPPVTNNATVPPTTPLGGIRADSSEFTASFTYAVDNDGGFTTQLVPGTFQGTTLTGPGAGSTFTIDQFVLAGLLSNNTQTAALASVEPAMETQTIMPAGGGTPITRYRICHRSRVLTWMGN
jgi:hypothetical protein